MSTIIDRYGLTADVVLVASMFAALFGSIVITPLLYTVGLAIIAVMAVVTTTQVVAALRA